MFNYYIAKVSVAVCMADIRINDVPLFRDDVDGEITASLPINHLIEHSGKQLLKISILPKDGDLKLSPNALCSVEIWRYDGTEYKIIPIEMVCSASVDVKDSILSPLKSRKCIFETKVAYQIERWSACKTLNHSKVLSQQVAATFKKIGEMLAAKQFSEYAQLIRKREIAVCEALGLGMDRVRQRNEILLEHLTSGFVYRPITGSKIIEFYAANRLVTVLDKDMNSALRFENEETGETLALDILLGIRNGSDILTVI